MSFAVTPAAVGAAASCDDKCLTLNNCCLGNASSCQMASCQQGCRIATVVPDEATCNATCINMTNHCDYKVGPFEFELCGGCSLKWLNPETLQPEILAGNYPWWPPGWQIPGCGSCNAGPYAGCECMTACFMSFNPDFAPLAPVDPPSPPDRPMPPAPWPSANGTGFNFSVVFSDHVVLQQAPAMAAVYGQTGAADSSAVVSVTVTPSSGSAYTVPAVVADGRWKALLRPTADSGRATTYSITATCASGCTGAASVTLNDVVFGDVWYCAGQSNASLSANAISRKREPQAMRLGPLRAPRLTRTRRLLCSSRRWCSSSRLAMAATRAPRPSTPAPTTTSAS